MAWPVHFFRRRPLQRPRLAPERCAGRSHWRGRHLRRAWDGGGAGARGAGGVGRHPLRRGGRVGCWSAAPEHGVLDRLGLDRANPHLLRPADAGVQERVRLPPPPLARSAASPAWPPRSSCQQLTRLDPLWAADPVPLSALLSSGHLPSWPCQKVHRRLGGKPGERAERVARAGQALLQERPPGKRGTATSTSPYRHCSRIYQLHHTPHTPFDV